MKIFALRVFTLYVFLLLPWPGLSAAYNAWFRVLGRVAAVGGPWIARVESVPAAENSPLSTRFIVGNPGLTDPQGNTPANVLDLDAWGVGWVPTAFVIALIAAAKRPGGRRLVALAWGLLMMNLYLVLCLRLFLWNGTADLFDAGEFARSVSGALNYTLITQMGAGFVAAVVIWLLVTFRAEDMRISREGR